MTVVSDHSAPETGEIRSRGRSAILWAGTLLTGFVFFWGAYRIWVRVLGVPFELKPGPITLDGALERVRPWAPWWIMPSVTALIGMLLWRWIAQRGGTILIGGAARAYVLTVAASFVVAAFCLELGAIFQYVPPPPLLKIVAVLPAIFLEGLFLTALNLVAIPVAAILGILVASITRLALKLVK